jgi:hypothetical protein
MKSLSPESKARLRSRSRLVHLGRDGEASQGFINVPPYRGSTVLFPDAETLSTENQRYTYGTHGTPRPTRCAKPGPRSPARREPRSCRPAWRRSRWRC